MRRASQHPRASEGEAQQGRHLPALPSKGGNPHPTSAWAPTSPGQGQSAPAAPWALPAAGLSSSSVDALARPGGGEGWSGLGFAEQTSPSPFSVRPPSGSWAAGGGGPRQEGAGVQEWTAAGRHSTSLMGGAGQGLVQGRACTLSSKAHRGHLQRAEPGTDAPPRARTHPHPGVRTTGRPRGASQAPEGSRSKTRQGHCTARDSSHGGSLPEAAKVGVPGSGCLCLRHPQNNICQ